MVTEHGRMVCVALNRNKHISGRSATEDAYSSSYNAIACWGTFRDTMSRKFSPWALAALLPHFPQQWSQSGMVPACALPACALLGPGL